jgi:uncharacterized Fe-S radical SAM superfamily protein PflX
MSQYRPTYKAREYAEIDRSPNGTELQEAVDLALEAGLHRLDERKQRFVWLLR